MDEPDAGTLTGEVDFTITASIPGSINTYASNDGGSTNVDKENYNQRFILEVYDGENYTNLAYREVKTVEVGEKTSFDVRLLAKKYTFALWADFVTNESTEDKLYNTSEGLNAVKIKSNRPAGQEIADAYCYSEEVDLTKGSLSKTFTLKRPFGKIRLVSTDDAVNYTAPGSVTVTYGTDVMVPTGYNVLTGEASGENAEAGDYTFKPYLEDVSAGGTDRGELYILGIDYIIASKSATSVSFDVKVDNNGTRSVTNIPVSANKLTTVIGNFYTNEGNIEVLIEDEFENGEDVRAVWNGGSEEPATDESNHSITINSAEQLAGLAKMVNEGNTLSGYTVTLNTDIDLNNVAWTPIGPNGDDNNKFMGTFDGRNHTISNLKVTQEAGYHAAGLFGALNGTVKNLTIDGATIENLSSGSSTVNGTAVVAGSIYTSGLIDKVTVKNATVQGNRYLGGISGYVYGSITNCSVETIKLVATPDNLTGTYDNGDKVGGIVGYIVKDGSDGTVENCTVNNATIQGYRDIGGIAGCANSFEGQEVVINRCSVSDITLTQDFTNWYTADVSTIGSIFGRGYIAESNANSETDISILVKVYDTQTAQLALNAASPARTIEFADNTYDMTKLTAIAGKTLTFVGAGEETIFDYSSQGYNQYVNGGDGNFVFKNMTIQRSTATFAGMAHTASTSYENCTINGTYYVYETTAKFTDCKFNVTGDFYNCWLYGTSSATYEKCVFNCSGKSIYVDGNGETGIDLTTNNCVFNDNSGVENKAAIETGNTYGKRYSLTINKATVNGFSTTEPKSPAVEGAELGTNVWGNKNYMTKDKLSVTIDGEKVY